MTKTFEPGTRVVCIDALLAPSHPAHVPAGTAGTIVTLRYMAQDDVKGERVGFLPDGQRIPHAVDPNTLRALSH